VHCKKCKKALYPMDSVLKHLFVGANWRLITAKCGRRNGDAPIDKALKVCYKVSYTK